MKQCLTGFRGSNQHCLPNNFSNNISISIRNFERVCSRSDLEQQTSLKDQALQIAADQTEINLIWILEVQVKLESEKM